MTVDSEVYQLTITTVIILAGFLVLIAYVVDVPGIEALLPLAAGMCVGLAVLHHAVKEGWYPR